MFRLSRIIVLPVLLAIALFALPASGASAAPLQQGTGICDRTQAVIDAVLSITGIADCAGVTDADLAFSGSLVVSGYGSDVLLKSDFAGMTNVTNIEIDFSPALKRVPDDALDEFSKAGITIIELHGGYIEDIESGVFDGFTNLSTLDLGDNAIQGFDPDLFNGLSSLTTLFLNNNRLTTLDEDLLDGLSGLQQLFLSDNNLTTLDADLFDGLSALHTLEIEDNNLTTLDADLFDGLSGLRRIRLDGNRLTTLDEDLFDGLSALQQIWLVDNPLTALEEDLFDGLTDLRFLILHNNRLTTLDADLFDGLTDLRWLQLSSQSLTTLDADLFDGLSGLQTISLVGNSLTTLDADLFDGLSDLQRLRLSGNRLAALDADLLDGLSALWDLRLDGNRLTTLDADLFDGLSALRELRLDNNCLVGLDADLFDGLSALEILRLHNNCLVGLDADLFDGLSSLEHLHLYDNDLTTLDADLFDGADDSLESLYLQGNGIAALPAGIFTGLSGLARLHLGCNSLTALDLTLFDPFASTLTYLNIKGNIFTTPPTETAIRQKLTATDAVFVLTGDGACLPTNDVDLYGLTVSTGRLIPPFAPPGSTFMTLQVPIGASIVTVNPEPHPLATWTSTQDSDMITDGIQFDPRATTPQLRFTVTSEDGSEEREYNLNITHERRPASVARLTRLEFSGLTLSPAFDTDTTTYTASVPFSVTETTVRASALDADFRPIVKLNGVADSDGTVSLPVGSSTIEIESVAEDGTIRTYTVTITRAAPPLMIPIDLTATVPSLGGSAQLRWGLSSFGEEQATGFKHRYKPTGFADTEFTAWTEAPGGANANSMTITNLINNVEYVFEVATFSSQVEESAATTARATAVYRHLVRECP